MHIHRVFAVLAIFAIACGHAQPQPDVAATPPSAAATPPSPTIVPDAFDAASPASVAEAEKAAPDHGGALYACPMHPEVTSDQPGKCPKCGMDLVTRTKP